MPCASWRSFANETMSTFWRTAALVTVRSQSQSTFELASIDKIDTSRVMEELHNPSLSPLPRLYTSPECGPLYKAVPAERLLLQSAQVGYRLLYRM